MRELDEIRKDLDETDRCLVQLFERRMNLSREIAMAKQARQMPVLDTSREAQVLSTRAAMLQNPEFIPAVRELFVHLMALSRQAQEILIKEGPSP